MLNTGCRHQKKKKSHTVPFRVKFAVEQRMLKGSKEPPKYLLPLLFFLELFEVATLM